MYCRNNNESTKKSGGEGETRTRMWHSHTGFQDRLLTNSEHLSMEATFGFEPKNRDFADLRLRPLGHVASNMLILS